ncbi:hypothetical protein DPMN_188112 [Dreissena polymorpha]|uniref:Uncharacterized protein n=1 Tax=Dreissena polymorpha TaxID=45954 RepID=A0A9D4I9M7_DREPO|nr:hypothetical protein DPMN_188112 [Dreissena polymorpha]
MPEKGTQQRPTRLVIGPCINEIDRIVIIDVQYQFEVNRCRNAEIHFQGSSANNDGQTDGGDNRIIDFNIKTRTPIQKFHAHGKFQGSSANSVGGDSGRDGPTAE